MAGDAEHVGDVMADQDRREAELAARLVNKRQHRGLADGIKPGGRLVEKDDPRLRNQGPGQGDALLHAAGNLGRVFVQDVRQLQALGHGPHTVARLGLAQAQGLAQGQGNILGHRHGVEKRHVLKHVTAPAAKGPALVAAHGRQRLALKQDVAGVLGHKPDDVLEQNALAFAGLADDGRDHALGHDHVHAAQHRLSLEGLGQAANLDHGLGHDASSGKK